MYLLLASRLVAYILILTPQRYYFQFVKNNLTDSGLCATFGKLQDAAEDNFDKKDKLLTRYYFDAVTEQCYPFGAQECGGNQNRFLNLTECQNVCRIRKPSLSQRTNSTPTLPPEYT